ncbi:hypothetical protein PG994_003212 [Apiospora phragmitis]|uniref:Uncharacterized protein n=1 Tax=Apiospora phragmitis TaxID=2905665 RepID=A0ABR1VXG2_9PEZI
MSSGGAADNSGPSSAPSRPRGDGQGRERGRGADAATKRAREVADLREAEEDAGKDKEELPSSSSQQPKAQETATRHHLRKLRS